METLFTWIEVAASLANTLGQSIQPIEEAFNSFEKTREKVSEARHAIELLQAKPDATYEELQTITQAYQRITMHIQAEQSKLFFTALECVIGSLQALSFTDTPSRQSLFEDIQRKVQTTQLEKLLNRSHKETYTRLDNALRRLREVSATSN